MGARKINPAFYITEGREPRPINARYMVNYKDKTLSFAGGSDWYIYELIEIRTHIQDQKITYVLGEYQGIKRDGK